MMAVLDPVKLIIDNYPEGQTEDVECPEQPGKSESWAPERCRSARELYIEREDFMEESAEEVFPSVPGQ